MCMPPRPGDPHDVQCASNGRFDLVDDCVFQGQQAVVAGACACRLYKGAASTPGGGTGSARHGAAWVRVDGDPGPYRGNIGPVTAMDLR